MQNFYFKDSTEANENGDRNLFVILVRDHVQYIQSMPVRPSVSVRQLCSSQLPWTEKKTTLGPRRREQGINIRDRDSQQKPYWKGFCIQFSNRFPPSPPI